MRENLNYYLALPEVTREKVVDLEARVGHCLCTVQCILYNVKAAHCTLYTLHSILYTAHSPGRPPTVLVQQPTAGRSGRVWWRPWRIV